MTKPFEIPANIQINLALPAAAVGLILEGLGELPAKRSAQLLVHIEGEMVRQAQLASQPVTADAVAAVDDTGD